MTWERAITVKQVENQDQRTRRKLDSLALFSESPQPNRGEGPQGAGSLRYNRLDLAIIEIEPVSDYPEGFSYWLELDGAALRANVAICREASGS